MRNYRSRPHNSLTTKGKSFWSKAIIVLTNISTLWECRLCRTRSPHHPTKGHRMGEATRDVCKSCDAHITLKKKHAKDMEKLLDESSKRLAQSLNITYGEARQRLDRRLAEI